VDTNEIYTENGTVSNITNLLGESYSLILPNRVPIASSEQGILVF
jgi:hypothetical protein